MLLMPITRPAASASGPPELPGASRTSARTQARPRGPSDAADRMDDARRHRAREAERVADREDEGANPQRVRIPDHRGGKIGRLHFSAARSRRVVPRRDGRGECAAIGEFDDRLTGRAPHVRS